MATHLHALPFPDGMSIEDAFAEIALIMIGLVGRGATLAWDGGSRVVVECDQEHV